MPLALYIAGTSNDHAAGWAFCLTDGEAVLCEEAGAEPRATSYRMELRGLLEGVRQVWGVDQQVTVHLANKNILQTGKSWLGRWRRAGWQRRGGAIEHLDLLQPLAAELQRLRVQWVLVDASDPFFLRAKNAARTAAVAPSSAPVEIGTVPAPLIALTGSTCQGDSGFGAWAFVLTEQATGRALERRGGARRTTAARMELIAVIAALKALKEPRQIIEISTAGTFLPPLVPRITPLRAQGWREPDGSSVPNAELVQMLGDLLDQHDVRWRWASSGEQVEALLTNAMEEIAAGGTGHAERRFQVAP